MMRNLYIATAFAAVLVVSVFGFRGRSFTKPPIDVFPEWLFPGMKYQPKLTQQTASDFFADGRSDRPAPEGTVASSFGPAGQPLKNDDFLYQGKLADGSFARGFPPTLTVDMKLLERGRDRFAIYCLPCHGAVGDGNGITKKYGMGAVPTYHDDRLRQLAEGEIFNTITNGKGQMNPYADKLLAQDRWAVIAYVRALQRAQRGTAADVPEDHRAEIGLK
jgi:mono/diheme cytochrome c family protein